MNALANDYEYAMANKIRGMPQPTKYMTCPSQQIHVTPQPKNSLNAPANEYEYAMANKLHVMPQPTNTLYATANNYMNATAK